MNYLYGIHAVSSALAVNPEKIKKLYIQSDRNDKAISAILTEAKRFGISVSGANQQQLQKLLSDVNHQGVIAEAMNAKVLNEADLADLVAHSEPPYFFLILDGVTDPHNLGACMRSADAFGVQAIITPKDNACGLTPVVRKVACGAAESVPFVQVTNLARTIRWLKDQQVWVFGAAGEASDPIDAIDFAGSVAIALGSEGKGLRRLTRDCCDQLFAIPMRGQVSSLNVSVATGVSLYEVSRKRGA